MNDCQLDGTSAQLMNFKLMIALEWARFETYDGKSSFHQTGEHGPPVACTQKNAPCSSKGLCVWLVSCLQRISSIENVFGMPINLFFFVVNSMSSLWFVGIVVSSDSFPTRWLSRWQGWRSVELYLVFMKPLATHCNCG